MSEGAGAGASPYLDEPIRRLVWIVPAATLLWVALLIGFAYLLERTAPPPPELTAVEARIIELPPMTGGLQGGPHAPAKPKAHPAIAKPAPVIRRHHAEVHHRMLRPVAPLAPPSPEGTAKSEAPPAPSASAGGATAGKGEAGGVPGGGGSGSGAGLGSNSSGARAIYAPVPKIPDDLRENIFQAVAVAHFTVSYEGKVRVTLVRPTPNPRLNEILLETLEQWRFFPAMRNGVAINSQFDVRIPIVVR
jgi:periplasmic protein TonB